MCYLRGKKDDQAKRSLTNPFQKQVAPTLDGVSPCPVAERDENIMCQANIIILSDDDSVANHFFTSTHNEIIRFIDKKEV